MRTPQRLRRSRANAGEGKSHNAMIAGDERKFPLGVLRGTAIKSVTTVTNAAGGLFYDSHHKILFSGAFQPQPAGN